MSSFPFVPADVSACFLARDPLSSAQGHPDRPDQLPFALSSSPELRWLHWLRRLPWLAFVLFFPRPIPLFSSVTRQGAGEEGRAEEPRFVRLDRKITNRPTDRPTDQRTDRPTESQSGHVRDKSIEQEKEDKEQNIFRMHSCFMHTKLTCYCCCR